jgi:hypothetical protein
MITKDKKREEYLSLELSGCDMTLVVGRVIDKIMALDERLSVIDKTFAQEINKLKDK